MTDYTGKTIYLGIDVHKKTYAVTFVHEGVVAKKFTMKADPAGLVERCNRHFCGAKIESAYECRIL